MECYQYPLLRKAARCPLCLETKDIGLVICWPCHHSQKHFNDGDYSKRAKSKIMQAEEMLGGVRDKTWV